MCSKADKGNVQIAAATPSSPSQVTTAPTLAPLSSTARFTTSLDEAILPLQFCSVLSAFRLQVHICLCK